MSSFTLTNIATDIDSAITRVVSADTSPTNASQNMVTSGGVKAAIDAIGSGANGIITVDSFTDASIEDSDDGLTTTNTAIPTSKAVMEHILSLDYVSILSGSVYLPGGGKFGHGGTYAQTNYRRAVNVNIAGFSQILHVELYPPVLNSVNTNIEAYINIADDSGIVHSYTNTSVKFLGPVGNKTTGGSSEDTGNGYTTTYRIFGIKS